MSVIINEMEVAVAQPPEAAKAPPPPAPSSGPAPIDLRDLIRHITDRAERVRAG